MAIRRRRRREAIRTLAHLRADFGQVLVHGLGIDGGDDDRGSHAARRADGAEDVNGIVAVVAQHGWARANGRRDIFDRPFLADTGFVWNQASITLSRTVCRQGIQSQAAEAGHLENRLIGLV